MKNISLKLDDNEAINYYNKIQRRLYIEERLKIESELVNDESIKVLKEFEKFEFDDMCVMNRKR